MPTLELEAITLKAGGHKSIDEGMCVMEAVSYVAGEPWSDHPQCASPVIATFMRRWNDDLNDTDRQMLKPYIPRLIGTNTGAADDEMRAWMLTDWMVREYLPACLRTANLNDQADAVAALQPITDRDSCKATLDALETAKSKAHFARDAAWAAAGAAAGAAAWAAARAAAGAAAWDAARDAAGDAARAAAWAAAWAAAGDAARAAAWDAARDAASRALRPTVEGIQKSALKLLDRMIAIGK